MLIEYHKMAMPELQPNHCIASSKLNNENWNSKYVTTPTAPESIILNESDNRHIKLEQNINFTIALSSESQC